MGIISYQNGVSNSPTINQLDASPECIINLNESLIENHPILMTQRPKSGLLASQWEFPSFIVWSGDGGYDESEVPNIQPYLETAISSFKNLLSSKWNISLQYDPTHPMYSPPNPTLEIEEGEKVTYNILREEVVGDPITHIFSHQVHHMLLLTFLILPPPSSSSSSIRPPIPPNTPEEVQY